MVAVETINGGTAMIKVNAREAVAASVGDRGIDGECAGFGGSAAQRSCRRGGHAVGSARRRPCVGGSSACGVEACRITGAVGSRGERG